MQKRILTATAVMMASAMIFTGCASQEIQNRKNTVAAAASAAAMPTATPEPTPELTPEPINAWSLLEHLPDFQVGTLESPAITWPNGIPMNENPLTYNDGAFIKGLYSSVSGGSLLVTNVSSHDLESVPINGFLKLSTLENGDVVIDEVEDTASGDDSEKDITDFYLYTEDEEGHSAPYFQIGLHNGWVSRKMNSEKAAEDGMTYAQAFNDGLYFSRVDTSDFEGFPGDGTPEEQFDFLYATFGNPSGLLWMNNDENGSLSGQSYTTFEDYRDAKGEDAAFAIKNFFLVWNYDGFTVAAACSDNVKDADAAGTTIDNIYLFPQTSDTTYFVESDPNIFWGYLGYGDAPIRLVGSYTDVPGSTTTDVIVNKDASGVEVDPVEGDNAEAAPEDPSSEAEGDNDANSGSDSTADSEG